MSAFSKQDYELINLGVCIRNQADRLGIEHDGVPLEGVVVRIAERAAAVSVGNGEPCQHLAEEPEWEYGTIRSVVDGWERGDRYGDGSYVDARSISDRLNHDPSTITGARTLEHAVRRRKAGPWVPVKQEGSDGG